MASDIITITIDGAGVETGWHYFHRDPLLLITGTSWNGIITVQYSADGGTTATNAERFTGDAVRMLEVPGSGAYINVACLPGDYTSGSAIVTVKQ